MNEKKLIRTKLMKNMIWNLIAFTMIFSVLDFIIYNQVSKSLYQAIDMELRESKQQYIKQQNIEQNKKEEQTETQKSNRTPENIAKRINPRLTFIIRDEEGNIINADSIGRLYEEYIEEIPFDRENEEEIYIVNINEMYIYRAYNFEVKDVDDKPIYVQVLANVDGEMQTLKNITRTLLVGTGVVIGLSIVASYLLSKRTIKPIVESWEKQIEFVQNASHELRTPLTIIQAKQELLLQEPDSKIIDQSENIHLALQETRRLTKLIKELMILARADADQYPLQKEETDIDQLLKEVSMPYIDYANAQEKQIKLELNFHKKIKVDRSKISQLFVIILDNSIKYTNEKDIITISTQVKEGKCCIEIADTGIGISQDAINHLFDRFYREDKARSRQTGGNGLGLSIAKTIVMAHGGTIKIIQNEPRGTKVIIKL